jgi:stage IV sporulation protein FB
MSSAGDAGGRWLCLPGRLEVRLHFALPLVIAASFVLRGDLWARYLLLLGVLVVHEVAHAAASLALGAKRAVVEIWPVFGRAAVENWADRRTAWVALAAPAANLLLGLICLLAGGEPTLRLRESPLLDFLLSANLIMGLGNLIPIQPIDGGRALAALRRGRAAGE